MMQNFDPAVASRVWQRVQASQQVTYSEKPACPLEGIPVVPAVAEVRKPCRQVQTGYKDCSWLAWLIILLLCMQKC